ncbi:MAG: NAD-dependent epimerase/dehydratase family protein [Actinomycetota bacterium]|nr:NAD-dependent epimerase/dehydratase family protein [Actinomycetota bacterium]
MNGPAFLTGASGFVGASVLRRLVRSGRQVRALARSDDAARSLADAGATPIAGDLFDMEALLSGMRGCATVFHVAGVNAVCPRDPEQMMRANVEGAANIVRSAAAAGVRRVVHTSSAATIGEARGTVGREDSPHRGSFLSRYERSKFLGERRVLELGDDLGIEVVCVNPSSVQGPGRTGGSARLLIELVNRRRPVVVDTWLSLVDVDDCAAAHLLAESRGIPGSRYLLNAASLSTDEAVALLVRVCGRPRRVLHLPRLVASIAAAAAGPIGAITTRDTALCRDAARTLVHGHRYDGSLAERELGARYRPVEETLRRTLAWYARHGFVGNLSTTAAAAGPT